MKREELIKALDRCVNLDCSGCPLNYDVECIDILLQAAAAELLDTVPTIDPETLPIVQELRANLLEKERDAKHWEEMYNQAYNDCVISDKKLSRYEQAEQEGKFIFLPCKIGDIVWVLTYSDGIKSKGLEIIKCKVRTMRIKTNGKTINYSCQGHYKNNHYYNGNFVFNSIGKTVFLTRKEAEVALKERENDGI